jgi:Mg2+/citrate symporter
MLIPWLWAGARAVLVMIGFWCELVHPFHPIVVVSVVTVLFFALPWCDTYVRKPRKGELQIIEGGRSARSAAEDEMKKLPSRAGYSAEPVVLQMKSAEGRKNA